MEIKTPKTNIDELIAKAKALHENDKRGSNKGRPYRGIDKQEAEIISKIRQKTFGKVSLRTIHKVLKDENLTRYENYGTFNAAWNKHLAEKY